MCVGTGKHLKRADQSPRGLTKHCDAGMKIQHHKGIDKPVQLYRVQGSLGVGSLSETASLKMSELCYNIESVGGRFQSFAETLTDCPN